MTSLAANVSQMVEILPEQDQQLAYELVKKLVLAWDPHFTKVTPFEKMRIEAAEESGFVDDCEIDWDRIGV